MAPIRVLIADDDEQLVESLTAALTDDERIDVVASAYDGAEAVARCAEVRPDVVAMDIDMPAMDGVEATKRIRADEHAPPVILITARSSPRLASSRPRPARWAT